MVYCKYTLVFEKRFYHSVFSSWSQLLVLLSANFFKFATFFVDFERFFLDTGEASAADVFDEACWACVSMNLFARDATKFFFARMQMTKRISKI